MGIVVTRYPDNKQYEKDVICLGHTGAKRDQEEEEEDYLKLLQANRDRRGAESSYIRFGKRSSLLAPYNVKSYSCILEQVLKAKSEEELKQLYKIMIVCDYINFQFIGRNME